MVVRSTTASDAARRQAHEPVRMCIGCRKRAAAAELLRVVVAAAPSAVLIVPNPRRRAPGRGAWLHRDPACVALAERRRAFARALRVAGALDPAPVREYVEAHSDVQL